MKYDSLAPITDVMGRAIRALEHDNIHVDDRSIRLFTDRFIDLWKRDIDELKPHSRASMRHGKKVPG